MIFFIVQRGHEYTLRNFTDSWGRRLRGRISILNYNDLAYARRLRGGTYVFTDHDRLGDAQIELGGAVADQLARSGCKVISNPMKVARRTEFLHRLVEAGVNEFRAFAV